MATEIIMPKLGMTMKEGTVDEWLKKENEIVKKGEPIALISSDKLEKEIEAPADGVLLTIVAKENDVVPVAKPLGYIGQEGEIIEVTASKISEDQPDDRKKDRPASASFNSESAAGLTDRKRIIASPSARKLAKSLHVALETIEGTGPHGRITNRDVEQAAERHALTQRSAPEIENENQDLIQKSAPKINNQRDELNETAAAPKIKSVKGMRKAIADRMFESLHQSAQLTLMIKADVTELLHLQRKLRSELAENAPYKLTITDFIAKATIMALSSHPAMNSTYVDGEIHMFEDVHLGIAVALEGGLVVPVIRNSEKLSITGISKQIRSLSLRARQGNLDHSEIEGSTFTITNMGKSGTEYFTPVLNSPESGILGVGTIQVSPVFTEDNEIVRCHLLPLSLTFDHRVLDGAPAGEFLAMVKKHLEKPYSLLL